MQQCACDVLHILGRRAGPVVAEPPRAIAQYARMAGRRALPVQPSLRCAARAAEVELPMSPARRDGRWWALPVRALTLTSTTVAQTSPPQGNCTPTNDKHHQPRPLNGHAGWRDTRRSPEINPPPASSLRRGDSATALRDAVDRQVAHPMRGETFHVRRPSLRVWCLGVRTLFEDSVDKLARIAELNVTQIIQERCEALLI